MAARGLVVGWESFIDENCGPLKSGSTEPSLLENARTVADTNRHRDRGRDSSINWPAVTYLSVTMGTDVVMVGGEW